MKKVLLAGLMACAIMAGLVASELLFRSAALRDLAGRLSGRGHLVAIANGKGIYESDIGGAAGVTAGDLIVAANLRRTAVTELIDPARVDRELGLLQAQFGNGDAFAEALRASGFSNPSLHEEIAAQLRGRQWLEKRIAPVIKVTDQECRQFYQAHQDLFRQPLRFRASHLFLAAHAETPPDVIEEKELAITEFAKRLAKGEPLSQLAAEASEDEATKLRGGDLVFFSEARMAPEFVAEIRKLAVRKLSKPFRSHLGFHIAQLSEIKAARQLSFEEARQEISVAIANERRALQADTLAEALSRADYLRPNVH
ncbi:MAG TPA: peptidyl-prolyl cis-trans isomerase [Chthoniobacterales bacterium]|nr:peptidyl-prolyl cis-trans isomerase [Chthoniobacterales bacterium]